MSENDRSKRDPLAASSDDDATRDGHSIRRGQEQEEDTPVRRTRRGASESQDDTEITRTSRGNGDSRPRSEIPGNLSETGTGTSSQAPAGPARRTGPGTLPVGCARSAGSLMLFGIGAVYALVRIGFR